MLEIEHFENHPFSLENISSGESIDTTSDESNIFFVAFLLFVVQLGTTHPINQIQNSEFRFFEMEMDPE